LQKTLDPWLDVESALGRAFSADCPILRFPSPAGPCGL